MFYLIQSNIIGLAELRWIGHVDFIMDLKRLADGPDAVQKRKKIEAKVEGLFSEIKLLTFDFPP